MYPQLNVRIRILPTPLAAFYVMPPVPDPKILSYIDPTSLLIIQIGHQLNCIRRRNIVPRFHAAAAAHDRICRLYEHGNFLMANNIYDAEQRTPTTDVCS